MLVKELIEKLEACDPNSEVYVGDMENKHVWVEIFFDTFFADPHYADAKDMAMIQVYKPDKNRFIINRSKSLKIEC